MAVLAVRSVLPRLPVKGAAGADNRPELHSGRRPLGPAAGLRLKPAGQSAKGGPEDHYRGPAHRSEPGRGMSLLFVYAVMYVCASIRGCARAPLAPAGT